MRRERIKVLVFEVFHEFHEVRGCRLITKELNKRGFACSIGLLSTVIKKMGLITAQPQAYRFTKIRADGDIYPIGPIEGDFTADVPGTRIVGDITYLRTGEGWLLLATVIDLATAVVVDWCMHNDMRIPLIEKALDMARLHGHIKTKAVFRSDPDYQYASRKFFEVLYEDESRSKHGKIECVAG